MVICDMVLPARHLEPARRRTAHNGGKRGWPRRRTPPTRPWVSPGLEPGPTSGQIRVTRRDPNWSNRARPRRPGPPADGEDARSQQIAVPQPKRHLAQGPNRTRPPPPNSARRSAPIWAGVSTRRQEGWADLLSVNSAPPNAASDPACRSNPTLDCRTRYADPWSEEWVWVES